MIPKLDFRKLNDYGLSLPFRSVFAMVDDLRKRAITDLDHLTQSGSVRVAINRIFDFEDIATAHQAVEQRTRNGAVVIAIAIP